MWRNSGAYCHAPELDRPAGVRGADVAIGVAIGALASLAALMASAGCSDEGGGTGPGGAGADAGGSISSAGGSSSSAGGSGATGYQGGSGGNGSGGGGSGSGGGAAGAGGESPFTPDGCFKWAGAATLTLQQATQQYECVEVQAGNYLLDAPVHLDPGHTLRGVEATASILTANQAAWTFNCCDSMVADAMPADPAADPFHVERLTLDGAGMATYNVCCRGYVVDDVVMTSSRCSAIGIAGEGVTVRNSTMLDSAQHTDVPGQGHISCASGNVGGVDEGAAIYSQGTASDYGSLIEGNHIENSYGPALDINGAWGGTFRDNMVLGNSAWAAVSLYGASYWLVENNQISHPNDEPPQPYHPYCATGPAGGHSAGIFLCQDTDANNLVTNENVIRGNHSSSFYGILSIGADEVHPYWAPRNNAFDNNDVFGSNFGCADDFAPGQWGSDQNSWTGNNCQGTANTGPTTF